MNKIIGATVAITLGIIVGKAISNNSIPELPEAESVRPVEAHAQEQQAINNKQLKVIDLNLKRGTVVMLNTDVNTQSANAVIEGIRSANKNSPGRPIFLLIDSPGGSVLDGARMISAMQASKAPVYTVCLQICASMAAMTLQYGKLRYAVDRSIVMFHPASVGGIVQGELDKVVSRFSFLQRYVDKMDHYTAARAGLSYEQFKAKTSRELWIDAEDALQAKYIDGVVRVDIDTNYEIDFSGNRMRQQLNLSR